ncbi:MAG: Phosphate acyltransferase [Candidatus Anoxychlamydiales bacterium]|nr:Phosphate acyltransferase [Candidatus Anoxychlamydiales bacterium]
MKNNKMSIKIGIDLMESENSPKILLEKILDFSKSLKKNVSFVFFAKDDLKDEFEKIKKEIDSSFEMQYSEHTIAMDENPLLAMRRKKDSTIFEGLNYLKEDKIDAFISCGNTGALAAGATHFIKTFKTISRPALLALLPTKKDPLAILDVGASIAMSSDNLIQFALLGAAFQKTRNVIKPTVGLLNIGTEKQKGTFHHQKAYLELKKMNSYFEFAGNIEGKEVFEGKVDVLVTDGFTGNIFLKTSEGLASFVLDKVEKNIAQKKSEIFKTLKDLKKRLSYGEYPGAILIGIKKLVIKCHGYSSIKGIISAIYGTIELVENNLIGSIKSYLESTTPP